MDRSSANHLGSLALRGLLAAAVAVWLQAPGLADGLETPREGGLRALMTMLAGATDTPGPSAVPGLLPLSADGNGISLCMIGFGATKPEEVLHLGIGKRWQDSGRSGYFAGAGATFPGLEVWASGEDGEEPDGPPLALGTWVGAGAYWSPAAALRLGLGVEWTPGSLSLTDPPENPAGVRAVTAALLRW